jgi:hypothetical protein
MPLFPASTPRSPTLSGRPLPVIAIFRRPAAGRSLLLALPLIFGACREGKIEDYRIAKETDSAAPTPAAAPASANAPAGDHAGEFAGTQPGNPLVWTAPAAWTKKANSSMRKGSYTVGGEGGADLAITAFPGDVGGELANVNRWRGQLSLPPITEADLGAALTPLESNGLKLQLVDLAGGTAGQPLRMLGAMVPYEGSTWFFKLTGPAALVAQEKSAYLDFLRTVKTAAAPSAEGTKTPSAAAGVSPADMASSAVPTADGADLKWVAPAHWTAKPASGLRKATYVVAGDEGSGELSVTAFPGAVGGELANVNRWRGQLALPPVAEADLPGLITRETVHGLPVVLIDLTGGTAEKPVRLLGAIVPSHGANWFFKFTGPPALIAREQAAFHALVQSLQVP